MSKIENLEDKRYMLILQKEKEYWENKLNKTQKTLSCFERIKNNSVLHTWPSNLKQLEFQMKKAIIKKARKELKKYFQENGLDVEVKYENENYKNFQQILKEGLNLCDFSLVKKAGDFLYEVSFAKAVMLKKRHSFEPSNNFKRLCKFLDDNKELKEFNVFLDCGIRYMSKEYVFERIMPYFEGYLPPGYAEYLELLDAVKEECEPDRKGYSLESQEFKKQFPNLEITTKVNNSSLREFGIDIPIKTVTEVKFRGVILYKTNESYEQK